MSSIKVTGNKIKVNMGLAFLTHIFLLANSIIDTEHFIPKLKISTMCISILPIRKLRFQEEPQVDTVKCKTRV